MKRMSVHFKELAALVHQTFREVANHEMKLATNLQALVPTNKESPSRSAEYLHEHSLMLKEMTEQIKLFLNSHEAKTSE